MTTVYYIEENGNPNEDCNPDDKESTEPQYLIKWKGWSHIHNTWESEKTINEQKVKGLKKLENYVKKESDLSSWRRSAGPEDIDYFECQAELQQELVKTYNNVERIIGEYIKLFVLFLLLSIADSVILTKYVIIFIRPMS